MSLFKKFFVFGSTGPSLLCPSFLKLRQVGLLLAAVCGLLIMVISLVAELRLWMHGLQELQFLGSRAQAQVVEAHGLSCSTAFGVFPDQGLNLPALAGGLSSPVPPAMSIACSVHFAKPLSKGLCDRAPSDKPYYLLEKSDFE